MRLTALQPASASRCRRAAKDKVDLMKKFFIICATILTALLVSCAGTGQGRDGSASSSVMSDISPISGQMTANTGTASNTASGVLDFTDEKIGVEMAFVRGGTFVMGCTPEQETCWDFEKPAHSVTLSDYYIGKYTVTQKLWQSVMGTNPSYYDKGDSLPVHNVTWADVQEFISKINAMTGRNYRLPTEAEWEYAARGGTKSKGYKYAGSDNINDVAWYSENSQSKIHKAGGKEPNELGIYDMCGNISEWVNDRYGYKYEPQPQTDPAGPQSGFMRGVRGGGFGFDANYTRIAFRLGQLSGEEGAYPMTGFRLAMSPAGSQGQPVSSSVPVAGESQNLADTALSKRRDGNAPIAEHEKKNVAVYMAGEERKGIKGAYKILGGELARAISVSDRYIAVNRTEAILEVLAKEHTYQRSGAVTDEQIRDLGKQFGARYLCIAEISDVKGGTYYLDVRIVDVVTAKTEASATAGSNLADINEMLRVARELAGGLIGGNGEARGAPGRITAVQADDDAKPVLGRAGSDFTDAKIGVEMVFVRGGAFTMGCTPEQETCWDLEKPAHKAALSDYYIGKYPVTQKQWQSVMGANPSGFGKGDGLPVHNVTWADVQEFISKINKMTGRKYRLPTEAEWEYAARGGAKSKGYKFPGSDNVNDVAWYSENSRSQVQKAGAKEPNELGLYDMSGNVGEWVNDWFGLYEARSQTDPSGPRSGSLRVQRGGAFMTPAASMRSAFRSSGHPEDEAYSISTGFRLALDPS